MAMIKCPECGRMISDQAEFCPGCGLPEEKIQDIQKKKQIISVMKTIFRQAKEKISLILEQKPSSLKTIFRQADEKNQHILQKKQKAPAMRPISSQPDVVKRKICICCSLEAESENARVCIYCGYPFLSFESNQKKVQKAVERYREENGLVVEEEKISIPIPIIAIAAVCFISVIGILVMLVGTSETTVTQNSKKASVHEQTEEFNLPISEQFLTVNEYSRPGTQLDAVNGIVIHYIGNPGTDAQMNRDYYEDLKDGSSGVYASCNYIIGLDGTIIHCVPDDEVAYASGERNKDTISIECCHPDESGKFTPQTYLALVQLTAKLCKEYDLSVDQIFRHYDINYKPCPKYFVDDPDLWTIFLDAVKARL